MDANRDIVTKKIKDIVFQEVVDNIVKESELKNYRVVKVVNVDNIKDRRKLVKNIKIGFRSYKIVEICNLFTCNDIISSDLRAGVFMPARFAVYEQLDDDAVYISFLKPTAIARLFGSGARMMETATKMEKDMNDVMASADF